MARALFTRFIERYFGYYYLLYFFSFLSIYVFPPATPFLNVTILAVAYYLIMRRQRLDVVLSLMIYSKSMSGFIVMHNTTAYDLVNLLCNVVPLLIYITAANLRNAKTAGLRINYYDVIYRYKFGFLFFLFLTISLVINFSIASELITKRYLPILFFLLTVLFARHRADFSVYGMLRFCRALFTASLLVYFFTNYLGITKMLLESDSVFRVAMPSNTYSVLYFKLVRNYGFIWDHRILGIMAYMFLLLTLVFRPRFYQFDVMLSAAVVLTTTSRGAIVTYAIILAAWLLQTYRARFIVTMLIAGIAGVIFFISIDKVLPPHMAGFIRSFSPASKYNAISQRKVFALYAMKEFRKKPLFGHGVGYLSSSKINRYIVVDKAKIPFISDAFWYVLLAEMGLVGLCLYILFLMEVFFSSSLLNIALLCGFAVQLIGTDIPDMRFYYYVILVLVFVVNKKLKDNAKAGRQYEIATAG